MYSKNDINHALATLGGALPRSTQFLQNLHNCDIYSFTFEIRIIV